MLFDLPVLISNKIKYIGIKLYLFKSINMFFKCEHNS